jgi:Nif-specific regulatory protein
VGNAVEISRSITSEVAATGKYFLSSNLQDDPAAMARRSVRDFRLQSILCVPLISREKVAGTLYLDSRKATKIFSEEDLRFMESFANLAAVAIENARLYAARKEEASYWRREAGERHGFGAIIGSSAALLAATSQARTVAPTNINVLITGESGTGKELFARAIHYVSPRAEKRFIPINCSALPEQILESELFGVRKGAFTGAAADTRGLFEEADGGTIFLDEIADMAPQLQAKLLRVLQEGEIRRVGDTNYRYVNVRTISATNKDLAAEIAAGRFRQDLYFRLCGVELAIPPLRDRSEDIPDLAAHFLTKFSAENSLPDRPISAAALAQLKAYRFPGNVRELEHIVRRAALTGAGPVEKFDLPAGGGIAVGGTAAGSHAVGGTPVDGDQFDEATRSHIMKVLEKVGWNQTRAAEMLGLNRTTLQAKMKKLAITRPPE